MRDGALYPDLLDYGTHGEERQRCDNSNDDDDRGPAHSDGL
ncbi:Uncharacterised protein [Mycobacteroides abscessus subsp. abscessus]|nr:Uncharacterised protein [Mycobacteroides abscessus subsp. abscessus]